MKNTIYQKKTTLHLAFELSHRLKSDYLDRQIHRPEQHQYIKERNCLENFDTMEQYDQRSVAKDKMVSSNVQYDEHNVNNVQSLEYRLVQNVQ